MSEAQAFNDEVLSLVSNDGRYVLELRTDEIITDVNFINDLNAEAIGIVMAMDVCEWTFETIEHLFNCTNRLRRKESCWFRISQGGVVVWEKMVGSK